MEEMKEMIKIVKEQMEALQKRVDAGSSDVKSQQSSLVSVVMDAADLD